MLGFGGKACKAELPTIKQIAVRLYDQSDDVSSLGSRTSSAHRYWYGADKCSIQTCGAHGGQVFFFLLSAYVCVVLGGATAHLAIAALVWSLLNIVPLAVYYFSPRLIKLYGNWSIYRSILSKLKVGQCYQREIIRLLKERTKEEAARGREVASVSVLRSEKDLNDLLALRNRICIGGVSDAVEELKKVDSDIAKKRSEIEDQKALYSSIDASETREISAPSSLEVELDRQEVMGRNHGSGTIPNLDSIHEQTTRLAIDITGQSSELCSVEKLAERYVEFEEAKIKKNGRVKV